MKVIIQATCHLKLLVFHCFSVIQLILHPPLNTGHFVGEFTAARELLWVLNYSGLEVQRLSQGASKFFLQFLVQVVKFIEHCQSWPPKKLSEVLKFLAWFLSYTCDEHVLVPFTSYIHILCTFKDAIEKLHQKTIL